MAFIHYDRFQNFNLIGEIVASYPQAAEFEWQKYNIKCTINTRPVPKVDFNTAQLTDMIKNLNARLDAETEFNRKMFESMNATLDRILQENEQLHREKVDLQT